MVKKNGWNPRGTNVGVVQSGGGVKSRDFLHDLLQMNVINPSRNGFTDGGGWT